MKSGLPFLLLLSPLSLVSCPVISVKFSVRNFFSYVVFYEFYSFRTLIHLKLIVVYSIR